MNARPEYADIATGEIVDLPGDGRTPLQIAKSELARFKFSTLETVRADPRLSAAPCLAVVSVYLGFVTVDERTLKPTTAYASTVTLMARASIRSKTTARAARKLLEEHGYLVPTSSKSKGGSTKYHIENPHADRVQMHVRDAEEYLKQVEAARREDERRKKKLTNPDRGSDIDPTQSERGVNNWPDRGSDIDPNYLRGNLGESSSREGGSLNAGSDPSEYGSTSGDDPHLPYPIPESEKELTFMLSSLFDGCQLSAGIMHAMRKMLIAGKLTPAIVNEQRRYAS